MKNDKNILKSFNILDIKFNFRKIRLKNLCY